MILSVVHCVVVIQWVTLQLSKDLTGFMVGKTMKNKVNSRMLSPRTKEL